VVLTNESRIGSIKSIRELPPVWEPWHWEELLDFPVHETDRLYALLKTKMEIVQDIYQLQISYKERLEARKDKQVSILGPFNDGR
jgi:hypothetical protein